MGPITALVLQSPQITEAIAEEETSNPILPTINELFWALVFFGILWILMKYVLLPPVMKGFEDRAAKVRGDQAAADAASAAATAKLEDYESSLHSVRAESVRIVEEARGQAEVERRELVAAAEAEVAAQRAASAEQIAAAKDQARSELRASVAGIAVGAAEAIIERDLDPDAQTQAIEDFVSRSSSPS